MGRILFITVLVLTLAAGICRADGERSNAELECRSATRAIVLDGSLDEPAWQHADWRDGFRQSNPLFGAPASEDSRVAFLYDDQNIYIGIVNSCRDPREIVATHLRHRDNPWRDDFVQVIFDTYLDQTRGYIFTVNPLGAREEGQVNGPHRYNWDWNEVWDAEASITPDGWLVEIRIPLKILRFHTGSPASWGVNVRRFIMHRREDIYLVPPRPPYEISSLNYAAHLTGVGALTPERNLQAKPYILAGSSQGSEVESGAHGNMGADLKYSLTSDLTLDLTARTDFAQVESDDQIVNLSRFSVTFPEKRDFFLENAQNFQFSGNGGLMPFFSRRIGIYDEDTVPIDTGARLSGKYAGNDIGVMLVRTKSVDSLALDAATYGVARLRRNFDGRSYFGGIYTRSQRGGFASSTLGIDGQYYFSDELNAYGQYMDVRQHDLRTAHAAWNTGVDYTTEPFGFSVSMQDIGENFDPDLGYVRRPGSFTRSVAVRRTLLINNGMLRNITTRLNTNWVDDAHGDLESRSLTVRSQVNFETGDQIEVVVDNDYDRLSEDFELDDNFTFRPGEYNFTRFEAQFSTNNSRRWQINSGFNRGRYYDSTRTDKRIGVTLIASQHFNMSGNLSIYDIESAHGSLDWQVWRGRITYIHNANLSIASLLQYNSSSGVVSANVRLRLLYGNDSDLFIVFNERRVNGPDQWQLEAREAVVKVNYRVFL